MRNYSVAITGGIGSGKSTVSALIQKSGFKVFSADEIYQDLIKNEQIVNEISQLVGVKPLIDGNIVALDKKAVSSVVFNDPLMLKRLNDYTHKLVYDKINQILVTTSGEILFFEIPLLFESEMQSAFDDVIVVMRDKNARIESVIKRSGLTHDEVLARINNQYNYDNIDPTLHIVLYNDSDVDALSVEVGKVIELFKKKAFTNF